MSLINPSSQIKFSLFFKLLHNQDIHIRHIRCDNAEENKSLELACLENEFNISFEYTPRDTPQHNGVVERKYATLYSRMRTTMTRAGFPSALRTILWDECALTMTLLDNILLTPQTSTSSYEKIYNHTSKISQELRVFGEIGIVKTDYNPITTKLKNA